MTMGLPEGATLVLARHGRTTWVEEGRFQGASDVPLSLHGRAQAAALGVRLAAPLAAPALPVPAGAPTVVRHSPLSRAAETAGAIARACGALDALVADADLREVGHGEWEGLRHAEVEARWADDLALWRRDPLRHHAPRGEPLQDASVRAALGVERMLADVGRSPDPAMSVSPDPASASAHEPWSITVAHDGILRLILLHLLGLSLDHYWSFPFAPCGISVVEIRDERARLRAHNLDAHLASVDAGARIGREESGWAPDPA